MMGQPIPEWFDSTQTRDGDGMLSYGDLRPSEVVHLTIPDPVEQVPLVARSVTPPSPPTSPSEMMERGDDTARSTLWVGSLSSVHLDRSCTVFVMTPPNEHTSEGGRDDRGVPYHAESTLSSAQVLKPRGQRLAQNRRPDAAKSSSFSPFL